MNDVALLIAALLAMLFFGYLLGLRDEHNAEDGTRAQRRRAVRAEQLAGDRLNRILELQAERDAHRCDAAPLLTGSPGPARANHHGGLTATTSPAGTTTTGAHLYHLPLPAVTPAEGANA